MNHSELQSIKGTKFLHINVRSIYKKLDQISYLYPNLDFLCCSETWLTKKYDNALVNITGMSIFRNDRSNALEADIRAGNIPARGGGVAIYVKNKWSMYSDIYNKGTVITKDLETVCITVKKQNNRHMTVLCMYRPPKGSIDQLIEFLREFMSDPSILNTEIWILGDFNINFLIRNNPDVMKINKFLKENNLKQLIHEATRLTNRGGSCIDWIISSSDYVNNSGIVNDLISDHFPVYAIRKKEREYSPKVKKRVRVYKNFDADVFGTLLTTRIDWNEYYGEEDPNLLWDTVYSCMIGILEVMCPYKDIFIRKDRTPWFNNEIYECMYKRSRYIKLYRKTRNQDIFLIVKHFRNKCNKLVREAKRDYIKQTLETNRTNPRKFWRTLNSILKPGNTQIDDIQFYDHVEKRKVPKIETCDFLNDYFANVGNRKYYVNVNDQYEETKLDGAGLELGAVEEQEVQRLVFDIDTSKDSCIEGISTKVLKIAFGNAVPALCHLFSMSLSKGNFPRKWAIGFINILPKGGDKTNPSNWRPITQTCLPAKLLEKVVQKRFLNYLDVNDILSDCQFGFRKGRSTQQAVFELSKDLNGYMNRDDISGLIFLDISKAFDSLDHVLLLDKLREIGLAQNSMKWFKSYLDRKQVVRHYGDVSGECIFKNGIPQGSCLGPTLFIFYINDLFKYLTDVNVLMFADDCVLYTSGKDWNIVHNRLQTALNVYNSWGRKYNLLLNTSKSKAMLICNTQARQRIGCPAPFNADNRQIMYVHSYCYLGCLINDELTVENEYKSVFRKAEQKVYMLGKLRYFVDKKTALLIYKQAVLPYFDYAGFLLVSCNQGQKKDLQTLQNNALRLCLRYRLVDKVSERILHYESNLQSLEQRRKLQLLKLMYLQSKNLQNIKTAIRPTRAAEKIVFNIPAKCTTKYLASPYYIGTQLWNKLNGGIQRVCTIRMFEKHVNSMYKMYQDANV